MTYKVRMRAIAIFCLLCGIVLSPHLPLLPTKAYAQQLALTVNGDPITAYDIAQRMKLLSLLKQKSGKEVAVESLIADRLKLREISKFGIPVGDQEIVSEAARAATQSKIAPAAFMQSLQTSGISESHWKEHFKAQYSWNAYVGALNKSLEVSEGEIKATLSKQGKSTQVTEYTLQEIVAVIPASANSSELENAMRNLQGIKARFQNCATGTVLARSIPGIVVKDPARRLSSSMNPQYAAVFERMKEGETTQPERSQAGLEIVALCAKRDMKDDLSAGADVKADLLNARLEKESQKLYKELRDKAVVVQK